MKEINNQEIDNISQSALVFDRIFSTFDSKIDFLILCNENPFFIDSNEKYKDIKKCISILIENAKEEFSRKKQQQKLMPIITKISQDLNKDDIFLFFKNDNISFSLFCLMHISFKYDISLNSHGQNFHKHIIEALDKCAIMLITNRKGTHNEKK